MGAYDYSKQVRIASGVNALLGVWLIFSPLVFAYSTSNMPSVWNGVIVGAVITICGVARVLSPRANAGLSWTNLVLGGWTALSPWVFNYMEGGLMWNSLFVGLIVIALAIWSGSATAADRRHVHA